MNHRLRPSRFATGILLILFIGLLYSCSENPTDAGNRSAMEGSGDVNPKTGGQFLLSKVAMGPGFGGTVEVWGFDLSVESDSVVSFDLALVNATNRALTPPILFVVTSIVPNTVTVMNPDGSDAVDGSPFFDFSDDIGDDNVLSPGESTSHVRVKFRWPEPMAFSIGFHLVVSQEPADGVISGVVFEDSNEDGIYDDTERGIPGVPVELAIGWGDSSQTGVGIIADTDMRGRYEFPSLTAGVYRVTMLADGRFRPTSPNPLLVTLVELPDGSISNFPNAHFGVVVRIVPPPNPMFVFGPEPVGPGSSTGPSLDATFMVPPPMPPFPPEGDVYYVRVEPPMVTGPFPMWIDEVSVTIDGQGVYKFECLPDSLCPPPFDRMLIGPLSEGEHTISIRVLGSELAYLMIGVEHAGGWDIGVDNRRR